MSIRKKGGSKVIIRKYHIQYILTFSKPSLKRGFFVFNKNLTQKSVISSLKSLYLYKLNK